MTVLTSAAEVLVATGHDPVARTMLRRPLVRGWLGERGTAAWLGRDGSDAELYLTALGAPADVGALVGEVLDELPTGQRVTLPRGSGARLPAWVGLAGTDWDFRYLLAPPPVQPGEQDVVPVRDDAAVAALLQHSPRASVEPGSPRVRRWLGTRDGDRLVACAADTSATTGVGHLSAIAVHPECRGRGLGRAVTAALVRQLFADGCDVVALGMYADNIAGRAMYDALGFRDEHRFTSGVLQVRSRW